MREVSFAPPLRLHSSPHPVRGTTRDCVVLVCWEVSSFRRFIATQQYVSHWSLIEMYVRVLAGSFIFGIKALFSSWMFILLLCSWMFILLLWKKSREPADRFIHGISAFSFIGVIDFESAFQALPVYHDECNPARSLSFWMVQLWSIWMLFTIQIWKRVSKTLQITVSPPTLEVELRSHDYSHYGYL